MNEKSKFKSNILRKLKLLALFCSFSFALMAQTKTISGIVTSSDNGEALIGVTVMVKGTSTGTITDINGKYTINVPGNNAVLVFTMIGMKRAELNVGNSSVLNLTMSNDTKLIDEVVVTGYSSQRKADLTGAVSVVNVGALAEQSASNPMEDLQGQIAGVNITNDGSPGGGTVIHIRGIGTLNVTDPLYVIDGVPTMNGLQVLNPNDIESIQVLKDAASASIYGSRAANGVIIVTTKKAKEGQLSISASVKTTYSWYSSIEPVLNTQQYGQALFTSYVNGGIDPNTNSVSYKFNWNKNFSNPVLTSQSIVGNPSNVVPANTNWFKQVSQMAQNTDYNVRVSNGSDKGHTTLFFDYLDNNGIIITTYLKRITASMNSDYSLLKNKLVVGENFSMNSTKEVDDQGTENMALQALSVVPVHTTDGGWGGPWGGMNDRQNPVRIMEMNSQNTPQNLFLFGNVYNQIISTIIFANNHSHINFIARFNKETSAILQFIN